MTHLRISKTVKVPLQSQRSLYSVPTTLNYVDALPPTPPPVRHGATSLKLHSNSEQQHQQQNPHSPLALALTQTATSVLDPSSPHAIPLPFSFFHLPILRKSRPHSQTQRARQAPFQFLPGAHGIPKCRPHRPPSLHLDLDLAVQVGEDSYFLRPDALGVADGVGGWSSSHPNSNSALFARRLMHFCSHELSLGTTSDPTQVLQVSYDRCMQAARLDGIIGSSTALLAILRDDHVRIAHLGDCCVLLIRDGRIVYRSEEMQHSFNYPYQLGPLSQSTPTRDAQSITLPVQENDILILSTDGMSDNLWDEDILEEVVKFAAWAKRSPETLAQDNPTIHPPLYGPSLTWNWSLRTWSTSPDPAVSRSSSYFPTPNLVTPPSPSVSLLPSALSQALCTKAKNASNGKLPSSEKIGQVPFGKRAKEEGIPFTGGKADDITVVVALIQAHR